MKDYIVAENHQLLGTAGIAQIAAQTVQNTREIATISAEVKELSGEVRDIRSDLGKINVDLRMVMENFVDPSSFRHFLILNGHKLEADVAYAQIYGMAKKSVLIVENDVNIQTLEKQKMPASSKTGNVIELCEDLWVPVPPSSCLPPLLSGDSCSGQPSSRLTVPSVLRPP